jgi:hypothetical protein
MATISGGTGNDAATVINGTDVNGTPVRNGTVTVTRTAGTTLSGTDREFDVNLGGGNDTLVGENMIWINDGSPVVAFRNISMGAGDDSVSLYRSAFRDMNMGDGNDTLVLELSAGRGVSMGAGADEVRIGGNPDATLSDAELAQKNGAPTLTLDGGTGVDTLNLQGAWTLTLSSGNVTMDTNGDGNPDRVTNVYTNEDVRFITGYPTVLNGTVSFGTITLSNGSTIPSRVIFSNFELINAVCFTAGTLVDTPKGKVAIETLREGDLVMTRNGPKALSWIGKRNLDAIDLAGNPKLLPVRVPAGAFGNGLPTRDVSFSPQHRVVIRSSIAERMFGSSEVLVSVKQLVGVNGIDVDGDVRSVQYFHLMFEDHQILSVEGIEAESLYPGKQAISFLTQDQLTELREIFPNFDALVEADAPAASAIPFLKGRESRTLAARHAKNDRPLYA